LLLLEALQLAPRPSLTELDRRLRLGQAILSRLLRGLAERGLARNDSGVWSLTPAGLQAMATGIHGGLALTRRVLHFVDNALCNAAPHFLKLEDGYCTACEMPKNWHFPRSVLEASLRQSPAWKSRHEFPIDIHDSTEAAADAAANDSAPGDLRHVAIDWPEALLVACVLTKTAEGQEALCGYAIRPESWTLRHFEPAFRLGPDWRLVLPGLVPEVEPEVWHRAWTAWCLARGVPLPGGEPWHPERPDIRLRVSVTRPLLDRLRPFRGEAWLLSDNAAIREVARVELVEVR
jgi:hypothetical protein